MDARDLGEKLVERCVRFGLRLDARVVEGLVRYLMLLRHWNRRMNLTALPLEPLSDATVDRLVVEPLAAIGHLPNETTSLLDIGSGAGSPAIPMKLARPSLRLTMVEARVRKSAFLREAARHLGLANVVVETKVFGAQGLASGSTFDAIALRAVNIAELREGLRESSSPGTCLLHFTSEDPMGPEWPEWKEQGLFPLPGSSLRISTRQ